MKANKTFIIRNKTTLEIWVAESGKRAWKAPNHAKAAWALSCSKVVSDPLMSPFLKPRPAGYQWTWWDSKAAPKFNEQSVYEVVEVKPEADLKLYQAIELLKKTREWITTKIPLRLEIDKWLEENEIK